MPMNVSEEEFDPFIPRSLSMLSHNNDEDVEFFLANEKILIDLGIVSPRLGALSFTSQKSLMIELRNKCKAGTTLNERKPRKPFRRNNRKIVIQGNNKFGRRGKLRCNLCRLRHSPCVFRSTDEPCDRCQNTKAMSCIKIWGPVQQWKSLSALNHISLLDQFRSSYITSPVYDAGSYKESNSQVNQNNSSDGKLLVNHDDYTSLHLLLGLELSRPVSLYDESIEPRDRMILQLQYTKDIGNSLNDGLQMLQFFVRLIALEYGLSISHPILRQAVLLLMEPYNPEFFQPESLLIRRDHLLRSLRFRLCNPNIIDETDLIVNFALSCNYLMDLSQQTAPFKIIQSVRSILPHLLDKSCGDFSSFRFTDFWLMMDNAFYDTCLVSETDWVEGLRGFFINPFNMNWRYCGGLGLGWQPTEYYTLGRMCVDFFLYLVDRSCLTKHPSQQRTSESDPVEINSVIEVFDRQLGMFVYHLECRTLLHPFYLAQIRSIDCGLTTFIFGALSCLLLGSRSLNPELAVGPSENMPATLHMFLLRFHIIESIINRIEWPLYTSLNTGKMAADGIFLYEALYVDEYKSRLETARIYKERACRACRKACSVAYDTVKFAFEDMMNYIPYLKIRESRGWLVQDMMEYLEFAELDL